jgi:hypothetical protein
MKNVLLSVCALALIVTSVGCARCNCNSCRAERCATRQTAVGVFRGDVCADGTCGHCGLCSRMKARHAANGGGGLCGLCNRNQGATNPGPASATVVYPYYTTRGPRDFLAADPRGIGP